MKMFYYFIDSEGVTQGPVSLDHFKKNHINGHTWVWHDGLPQWVEAHTVPSLRKYMRSDLPISFSTKKGPINIEKERAMIPIASALTNEEMEELKSRVPKTWLTESILITIFCCIPFGIIAIVYASRVSTFWNKKFYAESISASNAAGFWVKLTVVLTIMLWILYTILWLFTPIANKTMIWYDNYFMTPPSL